MVKLLNSLDEVGHIMFSTVEDLRKLYGSQYPRKLDTFKTHFVIVKWAYILCHCQHCDFSTVLLKKIYKVSQKHDTFNINFVIV